jgi:hypothetical protein
MLSRDKYAQYVLEIFLTHYAHEKISSHPRPPGGAAGRARLPHGRAIDSADDNPARSGHRAGHRASRSYFLPAIHSSPGFTVRRARRRLRPRHNRRRAAKFSIATVKNPAYAFVTADSGVTPERASAAERQPALPPDRGVAFVSIIPLLANSSFDPEAVEILSAAFDDAWEQIKQSGSDFARPAYERGAREVLAKYIIERAQRGERDRRQLSETAVKFMAQNYKQ